MNTWLMRFAVVASGVCACTAGQVGNRSGGELLDEHAIERPEAAPAPDAADRDRRAAGRCVPAPAIATQPCHSGRQADQSPARPWRSR